MRRPEINQNLEFKTDIPILYITQVLGLALGINPKNLGLDKHFVSTQRLISKVEKITVEV